MSVEMKDSGINGIGLIPNSWHTKKLGVFFTENSKVNYAFSSSNALQFKYGEIIQKANNNRELEEQEIELLKRYIIVEPNDIVVNGLNLNYDFNSLRIARVKESGIITSAYIVLRPKFDGDTSFFTYLLKTLDNQKIFHGMGVGIRLTLKFKELRSILIPVPPHEEEQSRIANFLDKKCAEIDGLIALQEQMIAQLNTYKQAVITETVIKGLDPNVKMKDSGVEWIGEIPEHWSICKIQYMANLKSGYNLTTEEISDEGLYPVYGGNGIRGYYHNFFNEGEYVLIGRQGALCGNINYSTGKFWATEHAVVCYPKMEYATKWFGELLRSMNLNQYSLASAQPGLAVERIKALSIPLPPSTEQQSIANYLDQKCKEIDELISIKKEKIEKLKTYKKSVIFEYVTGKKHTN